MVAVVVVVERASLRTMSGECGQQEEVVLLGRDGERRLVVHVLAQKIGLVFDDQHLGELMIVALAGHVEQRFVVQVAQVVHCVDQPAVQTCGDDVVDELHSARRMVVMVVAAAAVRLC